MTDRPTCTDRQQQSNVRPFFKRGHNKEFNHAMSDQHQDRSGQVFLGKLCGISQTSDKFDPCLTIIRGRINILQLFSNKNTFFGRN